MSGVDVKSCVFSDGCALGPRALFLAINAGLPSRLERLTADPKPPRDDIVGVCDDEDSDVMLSCDLGK